MSSTNAALEVGAPKSAATQVSTVLARCHRDQGSLSAGEGLGREDHERLSKARDRGLGPGEIVGEDPRGLRALTSRSAEGASTESSGRMGPARATTIRMLATLVRPDGGEARVLGHDIRSRGRCGARQDQSHPVSLLRLTRT